MEPNSPRGQAYVQPYFHCSDSGFVNAITGSRNSSRALFAKRCGYAVIRRILSDTRSGWNNAGGVVGRRNEKSLEKGNFWWKLSYNRGRYLDYCLSKNWVIMAKVFRVTPKRIKRSNGTVLTPEMSITVTTAQHTNSPFYNDTRKIEKAEFWMYMFGYQMFECNIVILNTIRFFKKYDG